ncbi:MAG: 30S ribosomal protein S4 [Nanoarchaeota archaeon]|nr:30S ribosomal protein S4 [Nanoarchaeota archaeon]
MGDPKHLRRKYSTPSHPWQKGRIEEEKVLLKDYGLKNKKEIWRIDSFLNRLKRQAKSLIARTDTQSQKEEKQLVARLARLNLVKENAKMDDILGLDIKNVMDRRLQTQAYSKGLSRTVKQARQFITHGHIFVGDKKVTIPSYLVKQEEENLIRFEEGSSLASADHPERTPLQKKESSKPAEKKARPKKERKPHKKGPYKKGPKKGEK